MERFKFDRRDYEILWPIGIFMAMILLLGLIVHFDLLEPHEMPSKDHLIPISKPELSDTSIQIGAYIENIYLFSANTKTFNADGWFWVIWSQKAQEYFTARKLTPDKWLHIVNQVDEWDFKLEQFFDEPIQLKDGHYYQGFKFSGHFYVNDLQFRKFPFQTLKLPLIFELTDFSGIGSKTNIHNLHLVPDELSSGLGIYIDITGYMTTAFNILTNTHEYGSNFGLDKLDTKPLRTNQVVFETSYKQSVNGALLMLFLPLVIVMTLVLFSLMLSASLWDIRLGVPPTALLTLIFLQQIHMDKLPDLPYITFLDMIYNICYGIILILFVLFLWGSNRLDRASEADKPFIIEHIDAIDSRFQIILPISLLVMSVAAWLVI